MTSPVTPLSDAYKVNSLTNWDTANPVEGEVVWDPLRSIWNASMMATFRWIRCWMHLSQPFEKTFFTIPQSPRA